LPFDVRKKLDDARKIIKPEQFAPNDPRRPEQPQLADWPGIEQLARDTLAQTSKDLLVAARLTEALVKGHGFAGLRDGLRLLRRLVHECWDRVYPAIEDGDLEPRVAPFVWLDDKLRGAQFPHTVRSAPLTNGVDREKGDEPKRYSWQDRENAQKVPPIGPVSVEAFDQAVAATDRNYFQTVVEDIAESIAELTELSKTLDAKFGEATPGLNQVKEAVLDCQRLAEHLLPRTRLAPGAAPKGAGTPAEPAAPAQADGVAPALTPRPLTREDVLARLADASALLLQMEPHSPIAYLVQRAVKLARLPLPELMKVLVRDPNVLGQLDRDLDLGIEKQEAAKQEAAKAAKSK
jgi:type VI secretion system protein ImpA